MERTPDISQIRTSPDGDGLAGMSRRTGVRIAIPRGALHGVGYIRVAVTVGNGRDR